MEAPRKLGYKVLDTDSCIIASPCFLWAVVISSMDIKMPLPVTIYDSRGSEDNKVFEFLTWYWQMVSFTPAVPIPMINGIYVTIPPDTIVCVYFEPTYKETEIKKYVWENGDELK